jgi:hypothetical protein
LVVFDNATGPENIAGPDFNLGLDYILDEYDDIIENVVIEILQPYACCLVSRKLLLVRLYARLYRNT